jgi:hypothetical protein
MASGNEKISNNCIELCFGIRRPQQSSILVLVLPDSCARSAHNVCYSLFVRSWWRLLASTRGEAVDAPDGFFTNCGRSCCRGPCRRTARRPLRAAGAAAADAALSASLPLRAAGAAVAAAASSGKSTYRTVNRDFQSIFEKKNLKF